MKRYVSLATLAFGAALLVTTGLAHAQTSTTTTTTSVSTAPTPLVTSPSSVTTSSPTNTTTSTAVTTATPIPTTLAAVPEVVQIGSDGTILLRGTVESASANGITIGTWGGTWTIDTSVTTDLIPGIATIGSVSNIRVGDYVGVAGTVNESVPWSVDATILHDWTLTDGIGAPNIPMITVTTTSTSSTTPVVTVPTQTYTGTVNSTGGMSFTIVGSGGVIYTVNTNNSTDFTTSDNSGTNLSGLALGNSVTITGTLGANNTITATGVQDTSH